jgi:hypothetical protein
VTQIEQQPGKRCLGRASDWEQIPCGRTQHGVCLITRGAFFGKRHRASIDILQERHNLGSEMAQIKWQGERVSRFQESVIASAPVRYRAP